MKNLSKEMKNYIILIIIAALAFWLVNNTNTVIEIISMLLKVMLPFMLGAVLAFILNIPMSKIEKALKNKIKQKIPLRVLSILISLLLFFMIISIVAFLLIPELINNIKLLINNIPVLFISIQNFGIELLEKFPDIQTQIEESFSIGGTTNEMVSNILNYILSQSIGFISSIVTGFITLFTALVFSVYMLSQKEYMLKGTKKVLYATLNKETADKVAEVSKLANKTFTKFVSGQCVEAIIIGIIIFLCALLFRFPYALIIAVLTTITALIPIFGALIAMIIGAILIGITNPLQAIFFILVFLVVQQIEGNFIYPKVVGKSVGLSPIWTLLAVTVGGSLFGITGMIVGLPVASIVYAIFRNNINKKILNKNIEV